MYSIKLPQIKERVSIGNDLIGFNILDITTTDSENHTMGQREIRLTISPLDFEISHHYKKCITFGVKIFRFALMTEISYGKSERS